MVETHDGPPRDPRRLTLIIGAALIGAGIIGLGAYSVASPGAVSYYTTPSEIAADGAPEGRQIRVGGFVAAGTLVRDGTHVTFAVTDGTSEVTVTYRGEIPDTLQEETDVVADGTLARDGTLVADRVLAKCSSKFEAEEVTAPSASSH